MTTYERKMRAILLVMCEYVDSVHTALAYKTLLIKNYRDILSNGQISLNGNVERCHRCKEFYSIHTGMMVSINQGIDDDNIIYYCQGCVE